MRTIFRVMLLLALALAACGNPQAQGASSPSASATPSVSAHFVEVPASATKQANLHNSDPWMQTVVFNELGLQAGRKVDYRLSASATANYACNSTTRLDQTNQQVVTAPIVATGSFVADASGAVLNQLTLQPPAAPQTTCPAGYQLGIWKVSYVNVQVSDTTNGVVHAEPDAGGQAQ